jgi:RNA polymerase sigma-70 factor (ECF subfamily)
MCLEDLSDDDLAKEVQAGKRLAMNCLVRRYERRLFGWLLVRVRNRHDAEDILQNLWQRVLGTIGNFRTGSETFFPWLINQMRSCLSSYFRSRTNHPEVLLADMLATAEIEPGKDMDPSLNLLRAEDWERLQQLLTRLPVEQQAVINLWFVVGLTGPQIAQQLGIPENTVHSRKLAALRKLRGLAGGGSLEL